MPGTPDGADERAGQRAGDPAGAVARPSRLRSRVETVLWIALVVFIGYRIWPQIGAALGIASANAPVPAFHLTTLEGQPVSDSTLRGRVALINFWATWCGPCRVEMPGFQGVYDRNAARGFTIVGISADVAGSQVVRDYLTEHHITYPVAMASGRVMDAFGATSVLPTSFLVDRSGRIRYEVQGMFAPIALEQAVKRLLAEPAAPVSGR